jgi:hypothetical protein
MRFLEQESFKNVRFIIMSVDMIHNPIYFSLLHELT